MKHAREAVDAVALADKACELRRAIVNMFAHAGGGHFGGSLSAAEIITALYFKVLHVRPDEPAWPERDRFVLSKGHAAPALYAALAERGFFPKGWMDTFEEPGNPLTMHPNMRRVPGLDASTGSMGHGLSIGVGMALAARMDGLGYRVFVLLGDGETQEGSIWEATMAAAHYQLDNLVVIVDHNCLSCDGIIEQLMRIEPIAPRWESFGWSTQEIDGHSVEEVVEALESIPYRQKSPSAIIARTVKGKGLSFMENKPQCHRINISPQQVQQALTEIDKQRGRQS